MLKNISIKRKLIFINLTTMGIGLLIVGAAVVFDHYEVVKASLTHELNLNAQIIASNSSAALAFNDRKTADEVLSALSASHNIRHAVIHDAKGIKFAEYLREDLAHPHALSPASENGYWWGGVIVANQAVTLQGEQIGMVLIESDTEEIRAAVVREALVVLAVIAGVFAVVVWLLARLQQTITGPLLTLAQLMRSVSESKEYSLRTNISSRDEIGALAAGFNDMLEQIQKRDEELDAHRKGLEQLVSQRTAQLENELWERKAVEAALTKNVAILDAAQRVAHLGHWEWDIAANSLFWSDEMFRIFGLTPQQFGGSYEAFLNAVHPDDRQRVDEQVRASLEQRLPYNIDYRIVLPDGTVRHGHAQGEASYDEAGRPARMLGTVQDITDRKQSEELLLESEQKFRSITTAAWDAIAVVDEDDKVIYWNGAAHKMFGYTEAEILGKSLHMLLAPPQYLKDYQLAYPRFRETGEGAAIGKVLELSALRKDGSEFPVELSVSAIRAKGQWHAVGIMRDITERKRVEQEKEHFAAELRRSNEELQQFAYIASHDLQEPLRMIASYLQLIERRYKEKLDEDGHEFIRFAVDGAARLQGMINGLLLFSRVETKGKPFEPTDCELVLEQSLANLEIAIHDAAAVVTHDPLPTVMADISQLMSLFQNLIGNAIKYRKLDQAPRVHVSAAQSGDEWVFSVRDNGIGFDPKYSERIFGIFQRLHGREEYPGTGIGLAVCKRIVERHKGRIWVESEPGMGATFYFSIPI